MSATLSSSGAATARAKSPAGLASATKRFGGVIAIRDVTIDLVAGEVLALSGRTVRARAPVSSSSRACTNPTAEPF